MDPSWLEARAGHEVLLAQPWGANAIRIRLGRHRVRSGGPGFFAETPAAAAVPPPPAEPSTPLRDGSGDHGGRAHSGGAIGVAPGLSGRPNAKAGWLGEAGDGIGGWDGRGGRLTNGRLRLEVWREAAGWDPALGLRFTDAETGAELLAEKRVHFSYPPAHLLEGNGHGSARCAQQFALAPGERLYGLGGRPSGRLDLNDQGFDLIQRNGEVVIPFVWSDRGWGLIWNHPGTGRLEVTGDTLRWTADQAEQLDYVVFWGGSPAGLLRAYADLTGHAPVMPDWALGLWQSHLRYTHQDQILAAAREYAERGLPLSVIVSDGGHWTAMGDFRFDPAEYPDPAGLMAGLEELGCRLMVSVWPTVSPLAESFEAWRDAGLLVAADQGPEFPTMMLDKLTAKPIPLGLIDSTNPRARAELWRRIVDGYHSLGVRLFWLDADEPEHLPGHNRNLSFYAGPGERVVNRYPLDHARAFSEGAAASGRPVAGTTSAGAAAATATEGVSNVLLLSRSAWLGQQALGCAVWSGDIPATWDSLARQVKVGQQMALTGIPWWTSDIGGFFGGDPSDPDYRELFLRWLQFGAYCPLFRIHGIREPRPAPDVGGPPEIWAFGDEFYPLLAAVVRERQTLRPYLAELAREAALTGLPPLRPLLLEFPEDQACWRAEDQFMLGPAKLVAPVTAPGVRSRPVYLPAGAGWVLDGEVFDGGQTVLAPAPLERLPVFTRR
ncbi:MAG: hypothetical protein LBU05_05910 [Bifidobacteriaceae bacterium]|jgi:alpha-D-xyloside xylohydrolase|nr:hypothetical protein [Bifidobacteriaceae bacterium]